MGINNFKTLLEQDSERMKNPDRILNNIAGTLGFFRMLGNIADIFISRVFNVIIIAAGGNRDLESAAPPPRNVVNPPDAPASDGPGGPGATDPSDRGE